MNADTRACFLWVLWRSSITSGGRRMPAASEEQARRAGRARLV